MSIKKEPNGRRSVQVEAEVPGTPEQVWHAIATGPGISSWFVPTQLEGRVGGALSLDFGGGMVSSAQITEWQPPHRFVAENRDFLQGGPAVATEWSVQSAGGGKCIVRVVHSLFASTDQWDDQIGSTESGWPSYFRVLRYYLQHHAGQPSASFVLMAPCATAADAAWDTLSRAMGVPQPRVDAPFRTRTADGAVLAGKIAAVDRLPMGEGVMVELQEPAPGIALASAMDCGGMRIASFQAFFYGPRAAEAAAQKGSWQQWLLGVFPPAATAAPTA